MFFCRSISFQKRCKGTYLLLIRKRFAIFLRILLLLLIRSFKIELTYNALFVHTFTANCIIINKVACSVIKRIIAFAIVHFVVHTVKINKSIFINGSLNVDRD